MEPPIDIVFWAAQKTGTQNTKNSYSCLFPLFKKVDRKCSNRQYYPMISIKKRSYGIIQQLSLKEKISLMSGGYSSFSLFVKEYIKQEAITRVETPEMERCNLPGLIITKAFKGLPLERTTKLPSIATRGCSWDVEIESKLGELMAREARAYDINTLFAISGNITRDPHSTRAEHSYGEDPYMVGELAAALTTGIQKHNVIPMGGTFVQLSPRKGLKGVHSIYDEQTLQEVYLPQFKRLVESKIGALKVSLSGEKRAKKEKGSQGNTSPLSLIQEELLGRCKFQGILLTGDPITDLYKTITAGISIEVPGTKYFGRKLYKAVRSGKISEDEVDNAVFRIVSTILRYIDKPDRFNYDLSVLGSEEHKQLSLEAAEKSLVLLKNEGVLPLDRKQVQTLAIVGDIESAGDTLLHLFYEFLPKRDHGHLPHSHIRHTPHFSSRAASMVEKADTAIIFVDGKQNQPKVASFIAEVAKKQPYLVVVLLDRLPKRIESWQATVPSILLGGTDGSTPYRALLRALFGEYNPGGKLPYTFTPESLKKERGGEKPLGQLLPYSGYNQESLFPLGHGLSYTNFTIAPPTTITMGDAIMVETRLENIGEYEGDEVVQLYVSGPKSTEAGTDSLNGVVPPARSVSPKRRLKGFQRVSLPPGESTTVAMLVDLGDLRYYDPARGKWILDRGNYTFFMGNSSRQESLQGVTISITG